MTIKIMMIKCISWKKTIKVTSKTNMIINKIPSWLLDKILVPYLKLKIMPNNSIMHLKIIKKILIFNTINSPNHISHQLKVSVPRFLLPNLYKKTKNNKNPKTKINKITKAKAMNNGKLIQNKNNKHNSKIKIKSEESFKN